MLVEVELVELVEVELVELELLLDIISILLVYCV